MGQDMAQEADQIMRLDEDDLPKLELAFDPMAFQEEHKAIKLADWMLEEKELALSAELATQIRKSIVEKAKLADEDLPNESRLTTNKRQRQGLKHSTPKDNDEGLLEKEIRD